MSNENEEPASERKSDIVATARKGSRSSPKKKGSMEKHMDHNVSILTSRLEEAFACVSSITSPEV